MATYEYKCTNEKCQEKDIVKSVKMPISEYSEDKLPKCEVCGGNSQRHYSTFGHQTFGDGYKG